MVDVNVEFNKGILFIRLVGVLNRYNEEEVEERVFEIITEGGIKYVVFNTEDLDTDDDISLFDKCNELIEKNDGKMILCGSKDNVLAYNYNFVSDELSALKLLTA